MSKCEVIESFENEHFEIDFLRIIKSCCTSYTIDCKFLNTKCIEFDKKTIKNKYTITDNFLLSSILSDNQISDWGIMLVILKINNCDFKKKLEEIKYKKMRKNIIDILNKWVKFCKTE